MDDRTTPASARVLPVALFTAAYLVAASAAAYVRGNREFVFYIAVMLLLIGLLAYLDRRIGFSAALLWALSVWGLAHMAGGLVNLPQSWSFDGEHRVLYSWWIIPHRLKFDQVVHAYGFGVSTWACWQGLRSALAGLLQRPATAIRPTLGLLTLCALGGMGCGAGNEVVEFIATLTMPDTNVGGYENTGWDLVSNLIGCVAAAVLIKLSSRQATGTVRP